MEGTGALELPVAERFVLSAVIRSYLHIIHVPYVILTLNFSFLLATEYGNINFFLRLTVILLLMVFTVVLTGIVCLVLDY